MASRPQNVGILAIESYIPTTYVDQRDLEVHDKVGKGKYTAGLGQENMACVGDREDVNTIACTVVQNLLEKNNINPRDIGRIEVGTETFIDKSKSTKTVIMSLFRESGNTDIEGITNVNACYGGIQAFFNTVAWVESRAWDGRLGIVVAADIAVYEAGPARCTGGAGAVAILVGPNASLVLDPVRTTYMAHEFDFYKPIPASEYPVVDGKHSINCYIEAIASCYTELKKRLGFKKVEDIASFMAFHSPFYKMVKKSFQKMMHMDLQATKDNLQGLELEAAQLDYKEKRCQELINTVTQEKWDRLVEASTFMGKNIGNTYCGALPFSLLSLIYFQREKLLGKRIMLFSYGSGLSSSLFTISIASNAGPVIGKILQNNPLEATLGARIKLNPVEYNRRMAKREQDYVRNNFQPEDPVEELRDGTFYLVRVDNKWRRFYARKITQAKL